MSGDSAAALVARQSIEIGLSVDEAFRLFTEGIGQWWPLDEGYSFGGDRAREIYLEPRVGGRFYERFVDGDELSIGTVVACEPPHSITFTWRSPGWLAETEVTVTFRPAPNGTTVELVHRGFDRLGPEGPAMARHWAGGWPRVIQAFADAANAA